MAEKSKNTQHISLRVPLKELAVIDTYAAANDLSRAQAVLHFVRQGIAAETGEKPVTKSDLVALAAALTKAIENRPVEVQIQQQSEVKEIGSPKGKKRFKWRFWL